MLSKDDPKAEYIFRAAVYLSRLNDLCRTYILQSFEERKKTFSNMRMECEALQSFSTEHFPGSIDRINELIKDILAEILRLEQINNLCDAGNCTVCNSPLKTFDTLVKKTGKITVCENCPSVIYKKLSELEGPTQVLWM